jgi:hypothetical protein
LRASFPAVAGRTHWNWSSSNPALPMRGLTRERLSTRVTLGLTSLHPHAVVPSLLSGEGKRIVLPAFFQRGRDLPDLTRQTLATAHAPAGHSCVSSRRSVRRCGDIDRSIEATAGNWPVVAEPEVAHRRRRSASCFRERVSHHLACRPPCRERLLPDQPGWPRVFSSPPLRNDFSGLVSRDQD